MFSLLVLPHSGSRDRKPRLHSSPKGISGPVPLAVSEISGLLPRRSRPTRRLSTCSCRIFGSPKNVPRSHAPRAAASAELPGARARRWPGPLAPGEGGGVGTCSECGNLVEGALL
jgi:hypothetical protein